jgi:hypothetical protein
MRRPHFLTGLLPAVLFACASPFEPAGVALTGTWAASNAYSGCSVVLELTEQGGTVGGTASSVCPSPGVQQGQITGSRAGALLQLEFAGVLGAPDHSGQILDTDHLRLDFELPDGPLAVRFDRVRLR